MRLNVFLYLIIDEPKEWSCGWINGTNAKLAVLILAQTPQTAVFANKARHSIACCAINEDHIVGKIDSQRRVGVRE